MAGKKWLYILVVLNLLFLVVDSVSTAKEGRVFKHKHDKTLRNNSTEIDIMEYAEIDKGTHIRPARQLISVSVILFIVSAGFGIYALMDAFPQILILPRTWFALFLNRTVNIEPVQQLWSDIRDELLRDKSPRNRERVLYILSTLRAIIHEHFDIKRSKMRDIVHSIQIVILLHRRVWNKYIRPAIATTYRRIREIILDIWKMIRFECIPRLKYYLGPFWNYLKRSLQALNFTSLIPVIPMSVYNSFVRLINIAWDLCKDIARDIHEVIKTIGEFISALINRMNFLFETADQFIKYMMGEVETFDYSPAPYIKAVLKTIRRKIIRFKKFLRHRINILREKINEKLRPIIAWARGIPKRLREKHRRLHKAWVNFRDKVIRWRKAKWAWFRRIMNHIHDEFERIYHYLAGLRSKITHWINEMIDYIKYRISRWIPYLRQNVVRRFKYLVRILWKAIRTYFKRLLALARYYLKNIKEFVELLSIPRNILPSLTKQLRRAISELIRILKMIFEGILSWVKKIKRGFQNSLNKIMTTVISIIKTITSIKETIKSVIKTIIRVVYNIIRYIIIFFRIKKLDKWRYIAGGVYYVLYTAHRFFYWVKDLLQIPFNVWEWMVERITLYKEWLKDQIFVKPGLFYFIGDVIRSIKENKAISGWLADKIGSVKLLRWIVHDGKMLMDIVSDWLSDTFIKQWIRTHVFRPTTTSTTTTRVPDLRPYFRKETILGSLQMGGCCNLPNHPLDEKAAGMIGSYLYELFNGESED